jgi:DNA-binding MarR family transcriptional regulator
MPDEAPPLDVIRAMRQMNIGRLLMRASRAYSERAVAGLRQRGHEALSLAHTAILPHIDIEGTRLSVLAERAGMTKQSASQIVTELGKVGYITRAIDPDDARAQRITFTALGQQFLRDAYAVKVEMEAEIVGALGLTETEHLREVLARFPHIPT